jgi:DNA helicase-2/ATP-dependent DNA helicase PcrA
MTGNMFAPSPQQQAVIDSQAPTLLVLGGAGTGKTVTAAAASRAHLARRDASGRRGDRVLFLTFSRTAVTQILDRSRGILRNTADRVDILTFHGFAWRLITDYGRYAGYGPGIRLRSEAERRLLAADPTVLAYSDLLPAALRIISMPVIGDLLKRRWPLIICDEFPGHRRPAVETARGLGRTREPAAPPRRPQPDDLRQAPWSYWHRRGAA